MKKFILLLFITIPLLIKAQDTGIHFLHEASWKEIQAKAKAQNKYIFMDCFTTWCGPCKYMSSTIFPLQEVGEFMNDKFVSVKVQLDTSAKDNELVKSWYQDSHDLAQKYTVSVYPTYLIFDADGNIVHRFVGSSLAEEFLANTKKSLNAETQYYTLLKQYNNGKKNKEFLYSMTLASADAYDRDNVMKISNEYLATQKDLYTKDNLDFIKKFTQSSTDKGFDIMVHNAGKVDAVLGKGTVSSIIQPIIFREETFRYLPADGNASPDWNKINAIVAKKYPTQADEAIAKAKVIWYQSARDWHNYQAAIVNYMNEYGTTALPEELNNYAWTVFQNCPDMKCVAEALEWSKRSFEKEKVPGFIDTYANILYKLGKKDEAIEWEQKAIDIAQDADKKGYQEVIDKMKKNEKTWN
ncbi:MAG TPA: thioredoxin fold domain-containing protein [Chitinophagaceae bacterium]|nr:thioredoxin fold domain-containing protein [Chitinophagaceae bacterium]